MISESATIVGFMISWNVNGEEQSKLYDLLLAEGGFEKIGEFEGDNTEPTISHNFIEVLALQN